MMAQPIEYNGENQPFIRLQDHNDVILSLQRHGDEPEIINILNDNRVWVWLDDIVPHPYTQEDAEWWINHRIRSSKQALSTLSQSDPPLVEDVVFNAIREVQSDGKERFIGSIGFHRCRWMEVGYGPGINWERKAELEKENSGRKLGNPDILWTVGYYLAPSHHGKGIMTDALKTLLYSWAIPRMGVRKLMGMTFDDNRGSFRVLEKSGLRFREEIKQYKQVRGVMRDAHLFDWTLHSDSEPP